MNQVNEAKNLSSVTSESPSPALLPCPFCGGQAIDSSEADEVSGTCYWVECNSGVCGGRTDPFFAIESAIEAWNTRPPASPLIAAAPALLEAAKFALIRLLQDSGDADSINKLTAAITSAEGK